MDFREAKRLRRLGYKVEDLPPAEREAFRAYKRRAAARSRERQRAADPEAARERKAEEVRAWREANPERARALNAEHNRVYRRRQRKRPATSDE
ncbi:hypothetical protein [Streptomyces ardesiacus]|uniref:hypothetical protein n=1 Tax=Streptomyces ardesiacus TaxID=285564 RepID=UPI0036546847